MSSSKKSVITLRKKVLRSAVAVIAMLIFHSPAHGQAWEYTKSFFHGIGIGARNIVVGVGNTAYEVGAMGLDGGGMVYEAGMNFAGRNYRRQNVSEAGKYLQGGGALLPYYANFVANGATAGLYGNVNTLLALRRGEITVDQASSQIGAAGVLGLAGARGTARFAAPGSAFKVPIQQAPAVAWRNTVGAFRSSRVQPAPSAPQQQVPQVRMAQEPMVAPRIQPTLLEVLGFNRGAAAPHHKVLAPRARSRDLEWMDLPVTPEGMRIQAGYIRVSGLLDEFVITGTGAIEGYSLPRGLPPVYGVSVLDGPFVVAVTQVWPSKSARYPITYAIAPSDIVQNLGIMPFSWWINDGVHLITTRSQWYQMFFRLRQLCREELSRPK